VPGSEWYYAQDNRQLGPVTIEALIDMIRQGQVWPTDLVWTENLPDWRPASTIPALMPAAGTTAVVPDANLADTSSLLNYVTPSGAVNVVYAGFWMRFAAWIIDAIILGVASRIIEFAVGFQGTVFLPRGHGLPWGFFWGFGSLESGTIVLKWLYYALMESSQIQGTVGKLALGIIVTDMQGQRIGFGRATGRYFGRIISGLTLGIGYMMAGWTEQKQALHDMMAGCLVIRKG
jgi:uncharacterized RDD family membrane protein YckC